MAPRSHGDRIGRYELLAPIGSGGMGEVWKARDSRLNRIVAIKFSKAELSERFEREARAIAALNHPHICQIHDVGSDYFVMEYIEGSQLEGPVAVKKAIEYAGQILDALEAAHRKGIAHRDLKPANVLVTKSGVKLLDFGLAKQSGPLQELDVTLTRALTDKGQIVGTIHYVSPEQLQGNEADARSDLFSFGCVLYELISGKRAFEGPSAAGVIASILDREPEPLQESPPVERVIRKCLAKDPDERFQNARDLKTALNWAIEEGAATKPARRWLISGAAALLLAAVGAWGLSQWLRTGVEPAVMRLEITAPDGHRFVFGQNSGGVALSPDGRMLAYVAQGKSAPVLWIRPLDGTTAREVTGSEDAQMPFWSPDSKSIGFFNATRLMRTDVDGAKPLMVCDAISGRGGAWSSDGRIIFATAQSALFQVPSSGGVPARLTTFDQSRRESAHYWPQILPGGNFLYWVRSSIPENNGIFVASVANPRERVQVLRTDTNAFYAVPMGGRQGYLVWLRGSTMVAQEFDVNARRLRGEPYVLAGSVGKMFNLGRMNASLSGGLLLYSVLGGPGRLTWFDRAGKAITATGEPAELHSFRLAPDGRSVVVARLTEHGRSDLWLVEGERGVWSRWTSVPGFNANPVWSPDGRSIVFGSGEPRNLFRKEVHGGTEHRLTESTNLQFASDWSKDGQFVCYDEFAPGSAHDIWVLPVGSEVKAARPWPYLQTPFSERWARFSPEATPRWIAYVSDETGAYEVYVQAFPERRSKIRISTAGGRFPQWGANVGELFYVSPDDKLMSVTLRVQGDALAASAPRELFRLPTAGTLLSPYEVSSDGQRILVQAGRHEGTQPLIGVVNWPTLLKRPWAAE